ncbi:CPBP family intramembrane metalloprotease [Paenibacillus sp. J5C_2022]|uniref:CPBP family intramembrane glutamic endopeptidase n=1 Tax=Paenibacillus sp. J5C2022 TaxID=2977129 RepID=UPI0021CF9A7D|nr:CPBP family intramembrane glutamic endopeptidase [Paenibacillus sp. J5C2022]MCU6711793.1 CPBP family intramembrane metalloprotease [Paenibacillus sp. J5C2022]
MRNEMEIKQYSVSKIMGLWALVAVPMFILRFGVMPVLAPVVDLHPGILYWLLMIVGMIWQFVLSVIVLKRELGDLSWQKLKTRLWLNHPLHPRSHRVYKLAYAFTVPIIMYAFFFESSGWFEFMSEAMIRLFPFMAPEDYTMIQNLVSPEFVGDWYLLGIALVSCIFNYVLGEELFFRGVLLPKMRGAFGNWDWAVNGILFGAYHLHKIAEMPLLVIGSLFYGFLNAKYRSFWPSVIIHGVEAIPLLLGVFIGILGLA